MAAVAAVAAATGQRGSFFHWPRLENFCCNPKHAPKCRGGSTSIRSRFPVPNQMLLRGPRLVQEHSVVPYWMNSKACWKPEHKCSNRPKIVICWGLETQTQTWTGWTRPWK